MSASKEKSNAPFVHATSLPAPYQLAIEAVAFELTVLDDRGARTSDGDRELFPATWFSVTLTAPIEKRYLYLVQQETGTGLLVLILMFDRTAAPEERCDLRLPPSGAWLRAVVDGPVYVITSDLVLSRKSITAWLGSDEPPTTPALPPYT
ncbi:MAG: hypothetical protein H7138_14150 [Myxococcales bacterium]|nr:hypothetical protein [Myxococcales bacterium]